MEGRDRYDVGEQIVHSAFGTGLVVEVRSRGFYDVLEVAFQDGVKRLTSIHPDIVGRAGESTGEGASPLVPMDEPITLGKELNGRGPHRTSNRRHAAESSRTPDSRLGVRGWTGFDNPIIELDPGAKKLLSRLKRSKLDTHREARLKLRAEALAVRLDPSELMAFDLARDVVRYAHQEDACRRIIGDMRGRALLADEVGLGKTVEAGVVLSEFVIRGLVKNALILVPASLQEQWYDELRSKFGLKFHVRRRGEAFSCAPFVITTLDTARVKRNQEEILEQSYDLVIIDEAHRLKNHRTLSYGFATALAARFLLLLTATPVHNDMRELYNLVTLLRPGTLGTYSSFRKKYVARGDRRIPRNTSELAERLSRVMIRTRREDTNIPFPKRVAAVKAVEPSEEEASLYHDVSMLIRDARARTELDSRSGWHLSLMVLQKEIGSSPRAAVHTLEQLGARLPTADLAERAAALAARASSLTTSNKLSGLLESIVAANDKVLVFTQFRGTLAFIADALAERSIKTSIFHGGLTHPAREEAIRSFRGDAQVLVSTDAGGEGRNLQFCNRLVNFDLPWNPMKIEQRIGRIHRLGQERDVWIESLSAKGTLESYVLHILHQKLKMFELVVGELDMILGHMPEGSTIEDTVFNLWTAPDNASIELEFRKLGDGFENARLRHEMICDLDQRIFESIREGVD